ncbi:MAG: RsbRD N-terminal domain-containing protein [Bryobacteraceae bacterium]
MAVQGKENIAEVWLWRVLRSYPGQSAEFLAAERDPFRNPVGSTIRSALGILLDELWLGMDGTRISGALDSIMQIRAVQDLEPSRALEFLFQLKDILRPQLSGPERELVDGRIDEMALLALDLYVKYRERTYQARANEARRRVYVLERRLAPGEAPERHERGGA